GAPIVVLVRAAFTGPSLGLLLQALPRWHPAPDQNHNGRTHSTDRTRRPGAGGLRKRQHASGSVNTAELWVRVVGGTAVATNAEIQCAPVAGERDGAA